MKLPVVSGIEVVKALTKVGYELDHQTGSHMIMRRKEPPYLRITVPNHREII
jgi:predicted RNA binding protein YcfA (HicA-like mRNA interferase family)